MTLIFLGAAMAVGGVWLLASPKPDGSAQSKIMNIRGMQKAALWVAMLLFVAGAILMIKGFTG
jgi:hypothetical protein